MSDITQDLSNLPPIKELVLHLGPMYESTAMKMLNELRKSDDAELIAFFEQAIETARQSALEVRANWEMGIAQKFFEEHGGKNDETRAERSETDD